MATSSSRITGVTDFVAGNKRFKTRQVGFSGNYTTAAKETVLPSDVGLKRIDAVLVNGGCTTTGVVLNASVTTAGVATFSAWESGASGAPLTEKGDGEAWPALSFANVTFIGY